VDAETHGSVEPLFAWGDRCELELKGKQHRSRHGPCGLQAQRQRLAACRGGDAARRRARELDVGLHALERLRSGAGGILTVSGEPA